MTHLSRKIPKWKAIIDQSDWDEFNNQKEIPYEKINQKTLQKRDKTNSWSCFKREKD